MAPSTDAQLLRGTLELLILTALARGPLHGYGIARHIEAATGDVLRVEEGSLYPALHRLEERTLVTARWAAAGRARRVRIYTITKAGRQRLEGQQRDWLTFAKAVTRMVQSE